MNTYRLAAEHFGLGHPEMIALARRAVPTISGDDEEKDRMNVLLDEFARPYGIVGTY
jgi:adenosine deaminase